MAKKVRLRFWIELLSACVTLFLLILTLVSKEWIEEIFGVDPDGGSGALEWTIVVAMAVVTAVSALLARFEWRRSVGATT